MLRVLLKHFGCIVVRIDRDGNEAHIGEFQQFFLQVAEVTGKHWAWAWTCRVDEVGEPDFPFHILETHGLPVASGELEIWNGLVLQQRLRSKAKLKPDGGSREDENERVDRRFHDLTLREHHQPE